MPDRRVMLPLVLAAAWAGVVGCAERLDAIDREVQRVIEREQLATLGPQSLNDPGRNVARPEDDYGKRVYDARPQTTNPSASELDVRPAEAGVTRLDEIPTVLDSEVDAVRLDLEGVIAYAIAHGPDYKSRKEGLFLATLGLLVERHQWGPRFFDTISATVDGTPESGDYDTSLTLVNEFTVTQRLPYGGSVSASALVDYVNFLRQASANGDPAETQGASLGASLELPLLRGAGMVAREDLIQAERDLVYAVRDFERFRREFFVDTANTYFDLLRQQTQIENQEVQLANLERLAEQFRALADAGRVASFRAEETEQQVLFARSSLLNQRESYNSSLDSFKIQIGMPTTQNLVIVPAEVVVPEPALDPPTAVITARANRLDLQNVRDRVEDAVRSVRNARNDLLPDLDLNAGVSVPTTDTKNRAGLDLDAGEGSYSAGAVLDLPLDRKIEQSNLRAALIRLERERRGYSVAQDEVALEVRRSIRQIRQAKYNLVLQEKNVELAERRAIGVRLRERELEPRDVIDSQQDLLDARNERDDAVAELRQSFLQYLLDTGQLRVDAQGRWQPPVQLLGSRPPAGGPDAAEPPAPPQPELEATPAVSG